MVQVDFYIPVRRERSGKRHTLAAIRSLERFLYELAGGYTLHGAVQGSWMDSDSGQEKREECLHYSVAMPEDQLSQLRSFLARRAKRIFDQKAIYCNVAGKVELL